MEVSDVLETVYLTRMFEAADRISDKAKLEAFDLMGAQLSAYVSAHHRIASSAEDIRREVLIGGMLVDCVVNHDSSRNLAIKDTSRKLAKIKDKTRDAPNKALVSRASETQVEAVWKKYEAVLHYAPIAAFAQLGPTLVSECDPEHFPPHALAVFRRKGLIRKALIMDVSI